MCRKRLSTEHQRTGGFTYSDHWWLVSNASRNHEAETVQIETRGGPDLDRIAPSDPKPPAKLASLIAIFKLASREAVKDIRSSAQLTDSAVCLVGRRGRHRHASRTALKAGDAGPARPVLRDA
jgi:hypothetical protein